MITDRSMCKQIINEKLLIEFILRMFEFISLNLGYRDTSNVVSFLTTSQQRRVGTQCVSTTKPNHMQL